MHSHTNKSTAITLATPSPFGALGLLYSIVVGAFTMFVVWPLTMAIVVADAAPNAWEVATIRFNIVQLAHETLRLIGTFAGNAAFRPAQMYVAAASFAVAFSVNRCERYGYRGPAAEYGHDYASVS